MTNNLPEHIAALHRLLKALPELGREVRRRRDAEITRLRGIRDIERWAGQYRVIIDEGLADVYRQISVHVDAILQLSDNSHLKALVSSLGKLTSAERADMRDNVDNLESVSEGVEFVAWVCKWGGATLGALTRRNRIEKQTAELERYIPPAA